MAGLAVAPEEVSHRAQSLTSAAPPETGSELNCATMERLIEFVVPRYRRLPLIDTDLHVLCVPSLQEALVEVYRSHDRVYDLVNEQMDAGEIRGRHPVLTGEIGGRRIVVKRLFHGGSTANLWEDRWLTVRRALDLVEAARHLDEHDIPTPELLFLSWIRRNGFVRVEVGFDRLFGKDADHYFFEGENPPDDWSERAAAVGRLVARLHDSHFEHGDLNMMNIFFADAGESYILDLDKAGMHDGPLGPAARERNLSRLERSVRKQGRLHGRPDCYTEEIARVMRESYERSRHD